MSTLNSICCSNTNYFIKENRKKKSNDVYFDLKPYPGALTKASKIVSEYDQEIPQSQTADNPVAPRGRAAQPSRVKVSQV